jgi:transcriptional regulator with XRE-family HTH domain
MVLLRQLLGDVLRRLRVRQGRTLREVSASARVSLGYLSEVERGRKEASSELLAAICAALETPLSQVFREVSDNFALAELQQDTVLGVPREPGLRVPAERIPAPASAAAATGASMDDVSAMDAMDVASVSDEFADHRSGFAGTGGSVRDITDMVAV